MNMETISNVTEFVLLGLSENPKMQKIIFVVFFLIYIISMAGNFLIMVTIIASSLSASPMHYFLAYLSFIDACYSSVTTPKLIIDSFHERKTILFNGCMAQIFGEHFIGGAEVILLTVMAYDRYILFIFQLPYCGPNVIDHFMCDLNPLLNLAFMDTHTLGLFVAANSGFMCLLNFLFLIISYVIILCSIRNHSGEARQKALSTCVSHITVVVLFFGPCIFMYLRPPVTLPIDKAVAGFYTMITPINRIYTETRNNVTEFVLLGLSENPKMQKIIFVVFFLIYIISMAGNFLIMVTIIASSLSASPMHYFLAYLSFIDACYSSVTTPKLIIDSFHERKTILFNGCMAQIFGEHFIGGAEVILLTVMAYDRYVAICKPLHYATIMN
ncbi:Olfactory receptor 4C46 [Galemys pyrenaicus]|uniref:Olfactory receptor 4C46 n=1 Tax=Galemys pyrenaicus TaxID=202257 RepID=A0A8J6A062_GALPY|nr:Olfactory receptor 4C46 [Galemys pyrenaicus]